MLEYELDLQNQAATQVWSYVSRPSVYAFVFGEPSRLDDGSTFINWGAAGQLEHLDPTGTSTWQLNTGVGYAFGFPQPRRHALRRGRAAWPVRPKGGPLSLDRGSGAAYFTSPPTWSASRSMPGSPTAFAEAEHMIFL